MNFTPSHKIYSRWASEEEIKSSLYKISLNGETPEYGGIPLFADFNSIYVEHSDSHTMMMGSTGSKKTRLFAMPSILLYARAGESFIVTDPKAELYEKTLPFLKEKGYHVFILNLRDPKQSNCWNPLLVPYFLYHNNQRDKAIELVNDMSDCIMQDECATNSYWKKSSSNLLSGLIFTLFECADKKEINFKSLRALRTQAFKLYGLDDKTFIKEYFLNYINKASFIFSLLSGTTDVCNETRSCIISEFDREMQPFFCQNNLINMLSDNELDMGLIGKEKTAVFLIIPDENTLYHRLISVFVKQCYTELIIEAQKQPLKKLPNRVNFLLDEFSSLPKIKDFPAMITASRSRNIRFNLIIQSLNQLVKQYGVEAETIKGNCENWIYLHSREKSLLEELIFLAGKKNSEESLITSSFLQTLSKDNGEAFILHKRIHPFISNLPDIANYPDVLPSNTFISYPENTRNTKAVFDFENFCKEKSGFFLSQLFSGKSMEEIKKICDEGDEEYYMNTNDISLEPFYTSNVSE